MSRKMYDFSKFARDAATNFQKGDRVKNYDGKVGKVIDVMDNRIVVEWNKGGTTGFHPENALRDLKPATDAELAQDPSVSEAQRKAMFAAKAGKSNIGIPQKVGAEFAKADPGGKLPARKR